jgi:hypothetical protein
MRHVIVGDVHGHYRKLKSLLSNLGIKRDDRGIWSNPRQYKLVFLGDLNDPRLDGNNKLLAGINKVRNYFSFIHLNVPYASSFTVIKWVKELMEQEIGVCIKSNHQANLIKYSLGKRDNLTNGLNHTVNELNNLPKDEIADYITWLDSLPFTYSFTENNIKYNCAHAYYIPLENNYIANNKQVSLLLYGPKLKDGYRKKWWLQPKPEQDFVRVAGHYHEFINMPHSIVLDGRCGEPGGRLLGMRIFDRKLFSY